MLRPRGFTVFVRAKTAADLQTALTSETTSGQPIPNALGSQMGKGAFAKLKNILFPILRIDGNFFMLKP